MVWGEKKTKKKKIACSVLLSKCQTKTGFFKAIIMSLSRLMYDAAEKRERNLQRWSVRFSYFRLDGGTRGSSVRTKMKGIREKSRDESADRGLWPSYSL